MTGEDTHDFSVMSDKTGTHAIALPLETKLDYDLFIDLSGEVRSDTLDWTAPEDGREWLLFFFWIQGTG